MPVPYLDMTITAAAAHVPPFYFCQGKTSKGAKKNGCDFTSATRAQERKSYPLMHLPQPFPHKKYRERQGQNVTERMAANFTSGIDNVSSKIPTILLIAAVVLLFGVIVLLVKQAGAMGIGAGGASL